MSQCCLNPLCKLQLNESAQSPKWPQLGKEMFGIEPAGGAAIKAAKVLINLLTLPSTRRVHPFIPNYPRYQFHEPRISGERQWPTSPRKQQPKELKKTGRSCD